MDIGVWTSRATLAEKLSLRTGTNPETTWSLRNWPDGFREGEQNRLFVAADGVWRGWFAFTEALFNPRDRAAPYAIVFNTKTWTPVPHVPARHFRGFTYRVPGITPADTSS
ncbi:MAG: hypothetical protein MUF10_20050 [Thermoanaerobaculaceae bacterium]|nr:hypothetical protein [Thermoanaerobaculaceae bacterium]